MNTRNQKNVSNEGNHTSIRSAYEVVADIVDSNPNIESINLVKYQEGPTWRDIHQIEKEINFEVLLKGVQQDQEERILSKLSRNEVTEKNLRSIAGNLPSNRLLGILSRVYLISGKSVHIPMMDFMCSISLKNQGILLHFFREFKQGRGCLLESGRSYHYYGFQLLSEEEWRIFLGKCLLLSGYTDDRYIGHQLVDGYCVLRLSAGGMKVNIPTVIADIP